MLDPFMERLRQEPGVLCWAEGCVFSTYEDGIWHNLVIRHQRPDGVTERTTIPEAMLEDWWDTTTVQEFVLFWLQRIHPDPLWVDLEPVLGVLQEVAL